MWLALWESLGSSSLRSLLKVSALLDHGIASALFPFLPSLTSIELLNGSLWSKGLVFSSGLSLTQEDTGKLESFFCNFFYFFPPHQAPPQGLEVLPRQNARIETIHYICQTISCYLAGRVGYGGLVGTAELHFHSSFQGHPTCLFCRTWLDGPMAIFGHLWHCGYQAACE